MFVYHLETSHLFCSVNQLTGFYMKFSTWLKWVNVLLNVILNAFKVSCRRLRAATNDLDFVIVNFQLSHHPTLLFLVVILNI